jgi:hypothetical protein
MNFGEIKTQLLSLASQDSGGEFEAMVGRSVNLCYRRLQSAINDDDAMDEVTLTTSADVSQYGLPINVLSVLNIEDGSANIALEEYGRREYDQFYPGTSASGDPRAYYILWRRGVQTQLSANDTIDVISSSASDTTNFTVRIQGLDANGIWQDEQYTLNGTTTVAGSKTFSEIRAVSTNDASGTTRSGTVTVTKNTGSTVLTRVPASTKYADHLWVEFYPIPDGATALTVRVIEKKPDLVNDDDWPQFDERWHQILIDDPGSTLMLAAGNPNQATLMKSAANQMWLDFKANTQRRRNVARPFMDVNTQPSLAARPLLPGVDISR